MKIEQIQSPVLKQYEQVNVNVRVQQEQAKNEIKKERGDSVQLSTESYNRLRDDELISDSKKSAMSINKNDNGQVVFRFTDKVTGEVIKEVPQKEAQENYERVTKYLERITKDIKSF